MSGRDRGPGSDEWEEGDPVRHRLTGEVATVLSSIPFRHSGGVWLWAVALEDGGETTWNSANMEAPE